MDTRRLIGLFFTFFCSVVIANPLSNQSDEQLFKNFALSSCIEPDPEYKAIFISDEACFYDISGDDEAETRARLEFYFKGELPAPLETPIWTFIESTKQRYPGWPEEWPAKQ